MWQGKLDDTRPKGRVNLACIDVIGVRSAPRRTAVSYTALLLSMPLFKERVL